MKLSVLKTASDVADVERRVPNSSPEWNRTAFAREVALCIVRYRNEHKLTQSALARKVGTTQSVIARLETGDQPPSLQTLAKLTAKTGMEFDVRVANGTVEFVDA